MVGPSDMLHHAMGENKGGTTLAREGEMHGRRRQRARRESRRTWSTKFRLVRAVVAVSAVLRARARTHAQHSATRSAVIKPGKRTARSGEAEPKRRSERAMRAAGAASNWAAQTRCVRHAVRSRGRRDAAIDAVWDRRLRQGCAAAVAAAAPTEDLQLRHLPQRARRFSLSCTLDGCFCGVSMTSNTRVDECAAPRKDPKARSSRPYYKRVRRETRQTSPDRVEKECQNGSHWSRVSLRSASLRVFRALFF